MALFFENESCTDGLDKKLNCQIYFAHKYEETSSTEKNKLLSF